MPLNPRAFGPPTGLERFGPQGADVSRGMAGLVEGMPESADTLENLGRLPTFGMAETGGAVAEQGAQDTTSGAVPRVASATEEEASGLSQGFGVAAKGLGALAKGLGEGEKDQPVPVTPLAPPQGGLAGLLDQGPLNLGVPPLDVNLPDSPLVAPPLGASLGDQLPPLLTLGGQPLDTTLPDAPLVAPDLGSSLERPPEQPYTLGGEPLDTTLPDTLPGGGLADLLGPDVTLPGPVEPPGPLPEPPTVTQPLDPGLLESPPTDVTLPEPPGGLAGLLPAITVPSSDILTDAAAGGPDFGVPRAVAPAPELPDEPAGGLADLLTGLGGEGLGDVMPPEPVGGLRGIGESDTPLGDAATDGITGGGVAGGLAGLARIGQSMAGDQSAAGKAVGAAGGAAQTYNAVAGMAGLEQIPYLNAILAVANAAQAGIEAEDSGQAAANIGGSIVDSAFNAMFGPVSAFMGGHGFGDIIRSLYRPDIPHDVREQQEVARVALPAYRYAQFIDMASTPEELEAALAMAPQLFGLVLTPDGQTISVQAGVTEGALAKTQQMLDTVLQNSRAMMEAAQQGNPDALAALEERATRRAEFMGAVQTAGLLPIDPNTGTWSTASSGSLGSVASPVGPEGALLNILVFGGASPNAPFGGEAVPTGGIDPETGQPIAVPQIRMPLRLDEIASRIPRLTPDEIETWRGRLFAEDTEQGTYDWRPQGYGRTVLEQPPETEAEITAAWEETMRRMQQEQGGG